VRITLYTVQVAVCAERHCTKGRHDHITPVLREVYWLYPSDSVSSSKWHVWFASRCPRLRACASLHGRWLLHRVR